MRKNQTTITSRHSCHESIEENNLNKNESDRVLVFVRVRPLSHEERENGAHECVESLANSMGTVSIRKEGQKNAVLRSQKEQINEYTYDQVFGPEADQNDVYCGVAAKHIPNILNGINVTILAYGATGSGKTHTMMGSTRDNKVGSVKSASGIIPTAFSHIFEEIEKVKLSQGGDGGPGHKNSEWSMNVTYCQVYNENVYDLLSPKEPPVSLKVLEDATQGTVIVQGLSELNIQTPQQGVELVITGNENRTTEATAANSVSSRSHAILSLILKETWTDEITGEKHKREAKLSLVDLAGSERASATLNGGARLQEGAKINRSLLALANCIHKLADQDSEKQSEYPKKKSVVRRGSTGSTPGSVVNYRDSKLTHLLKSSLEGRCRMIMIANINPNDAFYEDSHNTLKYANRAKEIKVNAESREIVTSCSDKVAKAREKEKGAAALAKIEKERQIREGKERVLAAAKEKKANKELASKKLPVWVTGKPKKEVVVPKPVIATKKPTTIQQKKQETTSDASLKLEAEIMELKAKLANQERQSRMSSRDNVDESFDQDYVAPSAGEVIRDGLVTDIPELDIPNNKLTSDDYVAPSAEEVISSNVIMPMTVEHKRRPYDDVDDDENERDHKRMRETEVSFSINESYETLPMPPARLAPPPPPLPPSQVLCLPPRHPPVSSSSSSSSSSSFQARGSPSSSLSTTKVTQEVFDAALADALQAAMKKHEMEHGQKLKESQAAVSNLTQLLGGAKSEIALLTKSLESSHEREYQAQALVNELTKSLGSAKSQIALLTKSIESTSERESELTERAEAGAKVKQLYIELEKRHQSLLDSGFAHISGNSNSTSSMTAETSNVEPEDPPLKDNATPIRRSLEDITNGIQPAAASTSKITKSSSSSSSSSSSMSSSTPSSVPNSSKTKNFVIFSDPKKSSSKVPSCAQAQTSKTCATHAFLVSKRWTRSSSKATETNGMETSSTKTKKLKSAR